MDGSSAAFVAAIDQAGVVEQNAPRRFIKILKSVKVVIGDSWGEIRPHGTGFGVDIEIDFKHPMIGQQRFRIDDLTPESFRNQLARARTFGMMDDVSRLWSAGFALGASFENTVVFDDSRVLNTEGLRFADECVRHKALDAIGGLALAGLPILGFYQTMRGGHKLNYEVLRALFADGTAWKIVEATDSSSKRQPAVRNLDRAYGPSDPSVGLSRARHP